MHLNEFPFNLNVTVFEQKWTFLKKIFCTKIFCLGSFYIEHGELFKPPELI